MTTCSALRYPCSAFATSSCSTLACSLLCFLLSPSFVSKNSRGAIPVLPELTNTQVYVHIQGKQERHGDSRKKDAFANRSLPSTLIYAYIHPSCRPPGPHAGVSSAEKDTQASKIRSHTSSLGKPALVPASWRVHTL